MNDANEIMIKTDNSDALINLHNKNLECYNLSCQIESTKYTVNHQTKLWVNATNNTTNNTINNTNKLLKSIGLLYRLICSY